MEQPSPNKVTVKARHTSASSTARHTSTAKQGNRDSHANISQLNKVTARIHQPDQKKVIDCQAHISNFRKVTEIARHRVASHQGNRGSQTYISQLGKVPVCNAYIRQLDKITVSQAYIRNLDKVTETARHKEASQQGNRGSQAYITKLNKVTGAAKHILDS
jgi:hypothetical protein